MFFSDSESRSTLKPCRIQYTSINQLSYMLILFVLSSMLRYQLKAKIRCHPANIRLDEDALKPSSRRISSSSSEYVFKTSSRRLDQGEYVPLSLTFSEDVFKTLSRRLGQDQYIRLGHMSSRRLQDVLKTSSRCLQNVFKTSSRRLQDVFRTF